MAPHSDTTPLERRKKVRLRARPNLQSEPRFQSGRRVYVVKDPVSLQYFHLEEAQHFALGRMDGRHTLDQIQQAFENEFKPQRLTLEELESFGRQLLQCGLVQNETDSTGSRVHQQFEKQQSTRQWLMLGNIFYYRIPLLRPNQILDRLVPLGRLLFHPLCALTVVLLMAAAFGLILTRWNEFQQRLPHYQDLFTWRSCVYLWLAVALVKILHELGHALCMRTFGGDVHDMGIVFMFFTPTLYCNVIDSWMLPQKWKRMAICAAGVYVEMILAALATFVWWASDRSTFINELSFWIVLICGVQTLLFNVNPLMRFDGYFLLSDWMEIPNLAQAANRRWVNRTLQWLGVEVPQTAPAGPEGFLLLFGLGSLVYRFMAIGSILYGFYQITKEHRLAWLGVSLILTALTVFAAMPVYRVFKFFKQNGKVPEMKRSRVALLASVVLGVVLVVVFVPLPMSVHGVGLVEVASAHQQRVAVPAPGGFLNEVFVRDGQYVRQGDILAVLKNPHLELDWRLVEADQSLRAEQGQALTSQLAVLDIPVNDSESLGEIRQELHTLAQQSATLKRRRDTLVLRAPCDGVVMGFPSWETQGKWLSEGTPLCRIGDAGQLRLLVLLEPADRQLLDGTKTTRFHGHHMGCNAWKGEVVEVARVDADEIPPQLSQRLGGDVLTTQDPQSHSEKPKKQCYLVSVHLTDSDHRLQVGAMGQVRMDVAASTTWWRFRRFLGTTFNWGL